MKSHNIPLSIIPLLVFPFADSHAALTSWVVWNTPEFTSSVDTPYGSVDYAASVTGTLNNVNNGHAVAVTYTGEATAWSAFNGESPTEVIDYWSYVDTYMNPSVVNAPTYGNYIATTGYTEVTQTLTFSEPVENLLVSIASLGDFETSGSFIFNRPFVILSSGEGAWGTGTMSGSGTNTLTGSEGNGVIQFLGTFTSISWTIPGPEAYAAFNVGITSEAPVTSVPEPGGYIALTGMFAGGLMMRRRRGSKQRP